MTGQGNCPKGTNPKHLQSYDPLEAGYEELTRLYSLSSKTCGTRQFVFMLKRKLFPTLALRPSFLSRPITTTYQLRDDNKSAAAEEATVTEKPSIFNELFPVDKGLGKTTESEESDTSDHKALPTKEFEIWLDRSKRELPKKDSNDRIKDVAPAQPAVLVLSQVSKSLVDSDFYRIGPQGKHMDGWNASIKRGAQRPLPTRNTCIICD